MLVTTRATARERVGFGLRRDALVARTQERLAESALFQGARFYHPSPGDFCDAMECYWTVWSDELRVMSYRL